MKNLLNTHEISVYLFFIFFNNLIIAIIGNPIANIISIVIKTIISISNSLPGNNLSIKMATGSASTIIETSIKPSARPFIRSIVIFVFKYKLILFLFLSLLLFFCRLPISTSISAFSSTGVGLNFFINFSSLVLSFWKNPLFK